MATTMPADSASNVPTFVRHIAKCTAQCVLHEGRGLQQYMHESDWHYSDTALGSVWLHTARSGGFFQIKLGPLGGATDSGSLHR